MNKDLRLIELFELYKGLLTERQREIFASYYVYDLSLAEIAEPDGTSRQSVFEAVKKVKNKLLSYEKLLKLQEKTELLRASALALKESGNPLSDKIFEIIEE